MTEDAPLRDKPLTPEAAGGAPADNGSPEDGGEVRGASTEAAGKGDRAGDDPAEPRHDGGDLAEVAAPAPGRPRYVFLAIVSLISLAADLGTKAWAVARLAPSQSLDPDQTSHLSRRIVVIKDHLSFVLAKNMGGAWGILQDESEALRRPFFLVISAVAVVFILSLYRKLEPRQWALRWGLPLVLGGALGNLIDRIRYAYVVDFIQIRLTPTFVWPTFNVADVAIVVGVGLMAIDMFTSRRPTQGEDVGPRADRGSSARSPGGPGKASAGGG